MTTIASAALAEYLSQLLDVPRHADYPHALNGLQVANRAPVHRIGAAVDLSQRTIAQAVDNNVNFLIVHHGLFWGGLQPLTGRLYERLRSLITADIAVYSVHLPLDSSDVFGNSLLLAKRLGLVPNGQFAKYGERFVGVRGESDLATADLVATTTKFVAAHESAVRTTEIRSGQRTRRWAICSGAGASSDTLREAAADAIDTLIVGEGPHHTAVEATELGITVIYAGHYATETLGVQALAEHASTHYGIPWTFLAAPSGL
ncbi:MAG: Nif3-like dinuclear metal center hexameric protein [Gemmatimonadota bacterium]